MIQFKSITYFFPMWNTLHFMKLCIKSQPYVKTWAHVTPTSLVNKVWKVTTKFSAWCIDANLQHGWVKFWKKSAEDEELLFAHFEGFWKALFWEARSILALNGADLLPHQSHLLQYRQERAQPLGISYCFLQVLRLEGSGRLLPKSSPE